MPRSRAGLLPAALLLLGVLAGCADASAGGAGRDAVGGAGPEEESERVGTLPTVDCPDRAEAVDIPADFPAPLPDGTVVVDVQERGGDRTVITGVVPAAEQDVLVELQRAYPEAGLTLTEGETEERDAESNFEGDGIDGRWGIRALPDCSPEATRIDLVARTG